MEAGKAQRKGPTQGDSEGVPTLYIVRWRRQQLEAEQFYRTPVGRGVANKQGGREGDDSFPEKSSTWNVREGNLASTLHRTKLRSALSEGKTKKGTGPKDGGRGGTSIKPLPYIPLHSADSRPSKRVLEAIVRHWGLAGLEKKNSKDLHRDFQKQENARRGRAREGECKNDFAKGRWGGYNERLRPVSLLKKKNDETYSPIIKTRDNFANYEKPIEVQSVKSYGRQKILECD